MKTYTFVRLFAIAALVVAVGASSAGAVMKIGGGIHYLNTLGDIKDADGFDNTAIGYLASAAFFGGPVWFEGDVEFIPDFGGSSHTMFEPQAYANIGSVLYGGFGMGIGRIDGDWQSDPFYALRAGINFLAGSLNLDVFTSYRFQKDDSLKDFGSDDLDTLTFGAIVRW